MAINPDENNTPVFPGGIPLQVARWSGQRESITSSASSQRITLPAGTKIAEITAVNPVFINFGDVTVDATAVIANDGSRIFLAGVQVMQIPLDPATGIPYTHVAVLQVTAAGIFQIEELQ